MKLWSHEAAQLHVTTNPQIQEFMSRRYGAEVVLVLPLHKGGWALMGPDRQLRALTDDSPTEAELRGISQALEAEAAERAERFARQREIATGQQSTDLSMEDLGL